MRHLVCLLGVLFLFGAKAKAQETPKVDVFAGYSYVRANPATSGADGFNMHGGSASLAWNANMTGSRRSGRSCSAGRTRQSAR